MTKRDGGVFGLEGDRSVMDFAFLLFCLLDAVLASGRSPVQVSCGPAGKERRRAVAHRGGGDFQQPSGHRLLPAPLLSSARLCSALFLALLLLLPLSLSSSSAAAAAASSRCLPAASMKKVTPRTTPPSCHDGPQAIFCVDVSILRYFSDQI